MAQTGGAVESHTPILPHPSTPLLHAMNSLYRIIPFNVRHGNCGGSLVQFQAGEETFNALPFKIGKVLVMSDIREDDVRGHHAHHGNNQYHFFHKTALFFVVLRP